MTREHETPIIVTEWLAVGETEGQLGCSVYTMLVIRVVTVRVLLKATGVSANVGPFTLQRQDQKQ